MIDKKTVLILGAGASKPYNFPAGRKLMLGVIQALTPGGGQEVFNNLVTCGFPEDLIAEFRDKLQRAQEQSVDAFLENQPHLIDVGKAAIAGQLIPCENEGQLLPQPTGRWYEYLFSKMRANRDDFRNNKLSVVTFNYDRSFEQALFLAVESRYSLSTEEAADLLSSIPIVHVHGQLGGLPYEQSGRDYEPTLNPDMIQQAAAGIKIIHESIQGDPEFALAHELLSNAEVICFLGFGYDPTNLERLQIEEQSGRTIMGSAYHLDRSTWSHVGRIVHLGDVNQTVLEYLTANVVFE